MKKDNKIVDIHITYHDFKKMRTVFSNKDLELFWIPPITWIFFSLLALIPEEGSEIVTLEEVIISDLFLILIWIAVAFWIVSIRTYRTYKKLLKNDPEQLSYTLEFFEKYLIKRSENTTQKILYRDIKKWREQDDTFFIETNNKLVIPMPKDIDSKVKTEIKKLDLSSLKKVDIKQKKKTEPLVQKKQRIITEKSWKNISNILNILFLLTLFTPWIAMGGWLFLGAIKKTIDFEIFQYSYGAFIALPIPLLSLILGICFKKQNVNATKNIVMGAIMCLITILISSFSFVSTFLFDFKESYSEIEKYKEVIGVELPSIGRYRKVKWDESYLSDHISSTITFQDKKESDKFYEEIRSSEKWISEDRISTNLENFMPIDMICSKKSKCRYLIYNKELNTYNEVPNESGEYHFQSMMYDDTRKVLKIEEFSYKYKN